MTHGAEMKDPIELLKALLAKACEPLNEVLKEINIEVVDHPGTVTGPRDVIYYCFRWPKKELEELTDSDLFYYYVNPFIDAMRDYLPAEGSHKVSLVRQEDVDPWVQGWKVIGPHQGVHTPLTGLVRFRPDGDGVEVCLVLRDVT